MLPLFSEGGQFVPQVSAGNQAQGIPVVSEPETTGKPEPVEKNVGPKVIKKMGSLFSPSIKDALSGTVQDKKTDPEISFSGVSESENLTEPFTPDQLAEKWREFLDQVSDRPNLLSTLSNIPDITDGNLLILKIGNSVQEEEIRLVKPELVNWLRRELKNSEIELVTKIERIETERTFFSDSEKLRMMIQKNPELLELKQRFNLDFKE